MSATSGLSISNAGTFTYDLVMVNAGGGYAAAQNWFVCPDMGFYLFSINALGTLSSSRASDNGIEVDATPFIGLCSPGRC